MRLISYSILGFSDETEDFDYKKRGVTSSLIDLKTIEYLCHINGSISLARELGMNK